MFTHRHKPKKFDYQFRYYDPEEDERRRKRIEFRRPYKRDHRVRSIAMLALGIAFIIWLIVWL